MAHRSLLFWGCAFSLLVPAAGAAQTPAQAVSFCPSCVECAGGTAPANTLQLKIYNSAHVEQSVIDALVDVANTIWQPYGVTLEPVATPNAVAVVIDARGETSDGRAVLGDTLFDDGHATPYIHLWHGAAEAIAEETTADGRSFLRLPAEERNRTVGRMLGVALAHELGHYLLDTRKHSLSGLLQASLKLRDTDEENLSRLALTDRQQQEICASRRK